MKQIGDYEMQACELELSIPGFPIQAEILSQARSETFRSVALESHEVVIKYKLGLHTCKQKTGCDYLICRFSKYDDDQLDMNRILLRVFNDCESIYEELKRDRRNFTFLHSFSS